MTTEDIINRFNLQVDDSSELSSDEELALLNQVYKEIQLLRSWEWLKKSATGTTSTTLPYIALPSDFRAFSPNREYEYQYGNGSVVFVGTNYQPFRVVSWSNRRNYRDLDGYCYLDIPNSRLYFTKQPTEAKAIEYDYLMYAPDLTAGDEPLFPEQFHEVISYGMAAKFDPIQLTNKGESYQKENEVAYEMMLQNMYMLDAQQKLAIS